MTLVQYVDFPILPESPQVVSENVKAASIKRSIALNFQEGFAQRTQNKNQIMAGRRMA